MKPFIDCNLNKRKETQQDIFKLANNLVFGKTMENVRKYRNVKFETNPDKVRKIVASPWYYDSEVIDEDIVMIEKTQKVVKLNKPIYCGMKILDISKFHMYDVWYTLLKPIFEDKLALILMDTDSFVFAVKGMDEETYNNTILNNPRLRDYLDFSKFPTDHPLYL